MARNKGHNHGRALVQKRKATHTKDSEEDIRAEPLEGLSVDPAIQQHTDVECAPVQTPYPFWANVPGYLEDMPQEAAEMAPTRWQQSAEELNYCVEEGQLSRLDIPQFGYGVEGAWDTFSDTSYAFSHPGSSILGGGLGDFG